MDYNAGTLTQLNFILYNLSNMIVARVCIYASFMVGQENVNRFVMVYQLDLL